MKEYKSLSEWLEAHGNPKHSIAGNMVLAVEDKNGMTLYPFMEKKLSGGSKHFWMGSGWGIRKEYFQAIKKFLNANTKDVPENYREYKVYSNFSEGYETFTIDALSLAHAKEILKERIASGRYPKNTSFEFKSGKKAGNNMSDIKQGEVRYFCWGNEPCGKVSTWTVKEDRSVKLLGYMDINEALEKKLFQECPYP